MTASIHDEADPVLAVDAIAQGEAPQLAALRQAVRDQPVNAPALNALGLGLLRHNDFAGAAVAFLNATQIDPMAVPLWLNLADARRRMGDRSSEIAALDSALSLDPYSLPALLHRAIAFEETGQYPMAEITYRNIFMAYPDEAVLPSGVAPVFERGRELLRRMGDARAAKWAPAVKLAYEEFPADDRRRSRAYLDQLCGHRRIYAPQPSGGYFPFLPADEFFDERMFPWFAELEKNTGIIQRELAARWRDGDDAPRPYVTFPSSVPVNQWGELNHSPRWGAYFLWRDGVPQIDNIDQCPETALLMKRLPLLDLESKGPTVMFSILQPHTRIPAHSGATNIRATVHLPLVVPDGCGFRVGGETRQWEVGKAWAFDDTIEHEAWNNSDKPRAILIIDAWNPHLTSGERAVIKASGG